MDSFEPSKRRRLTCSDMPEPEHAGIPSSAKAELADAAKFKEEINELMAPANFFLGAANGIPSPPPTDAPACVRVLHLTAYGLRCLQRFHEKHSFGAEFVNTQRCNVCGLDCTKMWPWMRDLPTGADRGWAFDENGLLPLSLAGSRHAMQDAEELESVGAAAEEVKPVDNKIKEAPVAMAAAEHPPSFAEEQKPYVFTRNNVAKQSGVPNINWGRRMMAWRVMFPKIDAKGNRISTIGRAFAVKKFMGPGLTEAQADAAALEAAMAFRTELVKKGLLSEPKPRDPNCSSEVPGVVWIKRDQKWHVQISLKGGKKKIFGGYFTEKAAAEAKALELREKDGLQREVKPVASLANRYAGLPLFQPKVPYPGVHWEQRSQRWQAQCRVGGVKRNFYLKPKDHSDAELERSFQVAVAWKKKQEKEKEKEGKAVKSKAKLGKKQRK